MTTDLFSDPRFAPLREMESFTDEMFNRIIAFQEKSHAAWDESQPFAERVKGLPLHYLIFSNPDRDPTEFGPTVAPYYPLREELRVIAHCARQVAQDPVVVDLHPGNGFIGSLLAHEGVTVVGARDPQAKPNQIKNFYDRNFYSMREVAISTIDFAFDVAFSAWMPSGVNLTPQIVQHRPKLIVFVYTDHADDQGRRQTGTPAAYIDLPSHYQVVAEWEVTRPKDLLSGPWPDLTGSLEEVRRTRIYADTPYHDIDISAIQSATPYDWEKELEMALLVMEAKEALRQHGMSVNAVPD